MAKLVVDTGKDAEDILKRLKVPVANAGSKKHFDLNGGMLRTLYADNQDAMRTFLDSVGFTA